MSNPTDLLHPTRPAARLPDQTHVGRVHLRVADLGRALDFYEGILGFIPVREQGHIVTLEPGGRPELPDQAAAACELIVLREVPGLEHRPRRPVTTGLYHAALLLPTRGALGRALLALEAAGHPLRGMSDHAVSESLYLDDPDGNGLEIYADRPRSAWPVVSGAIQLTVEPMDVDGVLAEARARPVEWSGLPRETVVGHVHFTVSQLRRSVAFFRNVVGFELQMVVPTLAAVSAGGYHHHLNLNTWAGEGAPADSEGVAGLDRWELVLPGAHDVEDLVVRLSAAGATVSRTAGRITAKDPDGAVVELVAPASPASPESS
jgi:catechol 2,3-dioxygenase